MAFPCDAACFRNAEWGGLALGFVQAIQVHGVAGFVDLVAATFGKTVGYEDCRFKQPAEVRAMLGEDIQV
jgi:hypothetical protein